MMVGSYSRSCSRLPSIDCHPTLINCAVAYRIEHKAIDIVLERCSTYSLENLQPLSRIPHLVGPTPDHFTSGLPRRSPEVLALAF